MRVFHHRLSRRKTAEEDKKKGAADRGLGAGSARWEIGVEEGGRRATKKRSTCTCMYIEGISLLTRSGLAGADTNSDVYFACVVRPRHAG